jgi:hypothetical protein
MSYDKRLRHGRVYYRAAFERRAKQQLKDTLSTLENKCLPSRRASTGAGSLHSVMRQMTWWPSADVLGALDSGVGTLAMLERKKLPRPLWKAFKLVNQRWPGYRLVSCLDALVSRARRLLEEAGESDFTQLCREASGSGKRASEAITFVADLRKIRKDFKRAAKIAWQDYEGFLFEPGDNRRVQLKCGDSPASARVKCYARALEIIPDHELREPMRRKAQPLLEWIVRIDKPGSRDLLKWDDFIEWMAERRAKDAVEECAERKRRQNRERQNRFRRKNTR